MKTRDCPECGEEMTYEPDDPSTGIVGGWYCDNCDETFTDEGYEDEEERE